MDEDFLHDLFAEFGAIEIKRMFSGRGIYARGVIFGIISRDGAIHFKTDERTRAAFEQENTKPLTFTKKSGQRMVTSYWRLPERLYDDPAELADWAREAVRVALAVTVGKSVTRKTPAGSKADRKPAGKSKNKSKKKSVPKSSPRKAGRV
ncbi:MAG TPA: TfoX/Sxy family protein [Pseudolabrys sp.]|nr:TfoX/Sxy family protein [Pseudolabrys sp.]